MTENKALDDVSDGDTEVGEPVVSEADVDPSTFVEEVEDE